MTKPDGPADRGSTNGVSGIASAGVTCPVPSGEADRVLLGHGSGGKLSAALLREMFLPRFGNEVLEALGDAAVVRAPGEEIAVSTDSFVVSPLEFPGGNIGHLAVHGTVNDLAMMGAEPLYLAAGFILEEGLPFDVLDRVVEAMSESAREAGVIVVTGDTKVVERGKADGMFINTTGIGRLDPEFRPGPTRARDGDAVIVSGPIGRHGVAIMAAREDLRFEVEVQSDTACLSPLVRDLRTACGPAIRSLRDPTRGGVASALNEIAASSGVGIRLEEGELPIPGPVRAACEMLGLDPLYVANEGILVAIVAPEEADRALETLRSHSTGGSAARIGTVTADRPGLVLLRTGLGASRVVDMLPGDQLPRIC